MTKVWKLNSSRWSVQNSNDLLNSKFNLEQLDNLFSHHPYILLLQKDDWKEYAIIIQDLYEILEDENSKLPVEVFKTYLIKFYTAKKNQNIENKIHQFFLMTIGELKVFKDTHDSHGQRYIETTRSGRLLLQWLKSLLNQRTKYSGTGAETLLGSLNDILVSRKQLSQEEALEHHSERIKKYQEDMKKIKTQGVQFAELLPIPHSNEALFNQADEAANQILAAVEDVKLAIEKERQELSKSYFEGRRSAGKNLNAITEFYEGLYKSPEYISYEQAKNLLSFLNNYGNRFRIKNVDRILNEIKNKKLIEEHEIKKSSLKNFNQHFSNSDLNIQDKIRAQIKILQQQVTYAMSTDVMGLQGTLKEILKLSFQNKNDFLDYFVSHPSQIELTSDFDMGWVTPFSFEIPVESESQKISSEELNADEEKDLILALLQAEEITLQQVLLKFESEFKKNPKLKLSEYPFQFGIAEYYVLCDISLFDERFESYSKDFFDLHLTAKVGDFVLRKVPDGQFKLSLDVDLKN